MGLPHTRSHSDFGSAPLKRKDRGERGRPFRRKRGCIRRLKICSAIRSRARTPVLVNLAIDGVGERRQPGDFRRASSRLIIFTPRCNPRSRRASSRVQIGRSAARHGNPCNRQGLASRSIQRRPANRTPREKNSKIRAAGRADKANARAKNGRLGIRKRVRWSAMAAQANCRQSKASIRSCASVVP